ncbi:hypothetical protein KFU94_18800 [Chloroflexi bacterium TSY]|nr:hypothetical protein [Chloroflexi bacterium TSY]
MWTLSEFVNYWEDSTCDQIGRSLVACNAIGVVTEIERNIDFLSTQMRDVIPRQRSLRAVFDHSWTLLNQEEQLAFQNLSVFADSFTENAAQQVANVSLFHLISLLDKSLVQRLGFWFPETKMHKNLDQHKGHTMQTRYAMHQVVRQYAAEGYILRKILQRICHTTLQLLCFVSPTPRRAVCRNG